MTGRSVNAGSSVTRYYSRNRYRYSAGRVRFARLALTYFRGIWQSLDSEDHKTSFFTSLLPFSGAIFEWWISSRFTPITMKDQIRTVAVIGCGVIGASWACLFLSRGLNVLIYDPAESAWETFENYLQDAWPALAARSPIEDAWAKNYKFIDNMELSLSEADFIQENGPERPELKQALMEKLDLYTRPGVIISSSSSGLPASRFIGRCQKDPSRILVGHPFNPPHLVPLVEVVPHPGTSATTISAAQAFYRFLGKTPILLHHEVPGFVANRLQAAINSEAYSLISRGIVSAKDLDTAMTSGPGLRWALTGPFVTNSLGGGGGPNGFAQRVERLGPAVRAWEEDMLKHRFDWSEESVSVLKREALQWLETVNWDGFNRKRDQMLLRLLEVTSHTSSP
ncbi:hypothetical protein M747DRAFT_358469 [Aspergillus niger ATCC 13496]|nr:hypothetical protein M747DRAFT_358469 [Aspergillus niger ATCC 13496]